ncbi:hypothetical protein JCM8115_000798 [Rhodotorula mucilaginosa]
MDRKRKWDEPAEAAPAGAGAQTEGDTPLKAVKTEEGASTRSASHEGGGGGVDKAAEAAAAIAARLASQYKGVGGGPPPPPPPGSAPPPPPPAGAAPHGIGHKGERDRDREAGLFVEDIEINDLRNRYLLTKGPTQQQILADTGANVLTRGVWYPDKSMATEKDPPLYLHIAGDTEEKLAAGVKAVRALIDQDLNLLAGGPRGPGGPHGPGGRQGSDGPGGDRDSGYGQRRRWPEEKLPIELEPLRNFNVRAKVVGPGGMFVKYIQNETGTRVQIKGLGSGYIETDTGRESDEPMHISVAGPEPQQIEKALELAKDLLQVIREKHAEAMQQGPPQHFHGGHGGGGFVPTGPNGYGGGGPQRYGGGGPPAGPGMGMGMEQQQQNPYQYQANQYASPGLTAPLPPGEAPPPPPGGEGAGAGAGAAAAPAGGAAASGMSNEQYMAWWNSLDAASQAYYTQYYAAYAQYAANPQAAQQQQQQQQQPPAPSSAPPPPPPGEAPPPPPPSDAPPPPPPPPSNEQQGGGAGRYGAVPPPAGL